VPDRGRHTFGRPGFVSLAWDGDGVGTSSDTKLVWLIEPDLKTQREVAAFLRSQGWSCETFVRAQLALERLRESRPPLGAILLGAEDLASAELWIHEALAAGAGAPVIVLGKPGAPSDGFDSLESRVFAVLVDPGANLAKLAQLLWDAFTTGEDQRPEHVAVEQTLSPDDGDPLEDDGLLGSSPQIQRVRALLAAVAITPATVLLTGETGTGKELVARLIHGASGRTQGAFVGVNCGEFSSSLLESELFGHVRGAFTGATVSRAGLFVAAGSGTLFLDEIGELELPLQSRLLRVLQESEVRPVGSDRYVKVDARVVAATNRPLGTMVRAGTFREDLYYRLKVFEIALPPLRERPEDIPDAVQHLLSRMVERTGGRSPVVSPDAMRLLAGFHWPGNIRQLQNVLQRAVILGGGYIEPRHLALESTPSERPRNSLPPGPAAAANGSPGVPPLREAKDAFERRYLEALLKQTGGNRAEAARLAHLDPSNLRRLLRRHQLDS
jgi:two-component system, NtrC family, response regulator GlrR